MFWQKTAIAAIAFTIVLGTGFAVAPHSGRDAIQRILHPLQAAHPTRVVIARTSAIPQNHMNTPDFTMTVTNPGDVATLYHDILRLPPFPNGTYHCPIDMGIVYDFSFYHGSTPVLQVVYDATGCGGLVYNGKSYGTNGPRGSQFIAELRSLVGPQRFKISLPS